MQIDKTKSDDSMSIQDAIEPKDIDVPEVAFRCGKITHEKYIELKRKEKYKDGRVQ